MRVRDSAEGHLLTVTHDNVDEVRIRRQIMYILVAVAQCNLQHGSYQMLDLVHEHRLGVLSVPTSVTTGTDQEPRSRIDHCAPAVSASMGSRHKEYVHI